MNILVTGVDGYIGSLLGPYLEGRGHQVTGLDTGFYRSGWLYHGPDRSPACMSKDIREVEAEDFRGYEAVVHLAELSNDPVGQLNPEITCKINHLGSVELARKAKSMGVTRFVYTSSCSVYGLGSDDFRYEDGPINPQTDYARCKVRVEKEVGEMADDRFSPTFLRNATAFGPSPRMRFDIVLNNLAGLAFTTGEISMTSDGMPWRPLVHLLDICEAVACSLEAPRQTIHNEIFNVGSNDSNYRVREVAETVAEAFPGCKLNFGLHDPDNRSYRVNFDKISEKLPGYACKHTLQDGARQLRDLFEHIELTTDDFEARPYTRLKQLEYLLRTEQIDSDFYWR